MTIVQWRCFTRREDVTAKQQLLVKFVVCLKTSTSTPTVLPVPRRVTQRDCTAVETSRESVPAAGLLFCSAKKVTKKGGPDDRALLTQGARVGALNGDLNGHFKSNGNGNGNGNRDCNRDCPHLSAITPDPRPL